MPSPPLSVGNVVGFWIRLLGPYLGDNTSQDNTTHAFSKVKIFKVEVATVGVVPIA